MTATAEAEAPAAKGGKKKLIIIIAAAVVVTLVAAALIFMTLFKGDDEAKEDPATTYGAVYAMEDDMTLNLADGSFLKTRLSLQLSEAATEAAGGEEALKTFDVSKARDATILVLGKYTKEDLLDPAKRESAQKTLSKEVSERYHGDVLKVYFTEFVMQ
ncbi:flagellar basal body-associated FliL family protein [Gephyromycinifex aptenodytis]|uniref:flagellar basal body-associated FliL family protein n=1 Tax=Gephyromycinifex aptenodytis TaxID=2716227 RepID=UPI001447DE0B|nr:flagellar basal body-associated FliL family protein [Gephyromycinifex aptenodytis]